MFLKKTYFLSLTTALLLSGCVFNKTETEPPIKAQNLNEVTAVNTDFISGINANDLQKRINARYIEKVMQVYALNSKEAAIEQIIEIESNYQFRQLLEKKGIHKAMNGDKVAIMALEENSYQLEKSKIEEKKLDGTIKTVIENRGEGISIKRSILNQAQSDNVAETKGALQALNTVEAKEVELVDNTKPVAHIPEQKSNMKVESIPEAQNLKNVKNTEIKKDIPSVESVNKAVVAPIINNETQSIAKSVEAPKNEEIAVTAPVINEVKPINKEIEAPKKEETPVTPEVKKEEEISKNTLVIDDNQYYKTKHKSSKK